MGHRQVWFKVFRSLGPNERSRPLHTNTGCFSYPGQHIHIYTDIYLLILSDIDNTNNDEQPSGFFKEFYVDGPK
jgi:hypothetical protein